VTTRLLLVDDHASFRAVAREVMERAGFEVVGEAGDGASAVKTAEALRPDAVLLDVGLPDEDGFAVCERLAGRGIPVVLMSSRHAHDYADRLAGTPARGFVPKSALTGEAVRELLR
jgi:DNA-binding NarL/FixJ family response regulator